MILHNVDAEIVQTQKDGVIVLRVKKTDREITKKYILKYFADQKDVRDKENRPLYTQVQFEHSRRARTVKQNSLYRALLSVLAFEVYGEHGYEDELHEEILWLYGIHEKSRLTGKEVARRSHKMSAEEFSHLIEGVFRELAVHGVGMESGAKIREYWKDWAYWRFSRKGEEDPLMGSYHDYADYMTRIPYCEACFKYLPAEERVKVGARPAHILGAAAWPEYALESWNWLHLCTEHHAGVQHQQGWEEFKEQFPHLVPRIEYAESRAGKAKKESREGVGNLRAEYANGGENAEVVPAALIPKSTGQNEDEAQEELEIF